MGDGDGEGHIKQEDRRVVSHTPPPPLSSNLLPAVIFRNAPIPTTRVFVPPLLPIKVHLGRAP